jgi:RNA polymerase sigma-70 factor (ECF subfamily)
MLLVENRSLLDEFRRGDAAALERVFEHYAPKVAAWVTRGFSYRTKEAERRFIGFRSAADVHDAIHESFRAAFEERARDGYSGLVPYEGYLFAITKNVVLKKLGGKHAAETAAESELDALPSRDPSPEDVVAREEERRMVQTFLSGLSDDDRRFVSLRFVDQLSQAKVAEELGWGRKKVRIVEESIRRALTRFMKRARGTAEVKEVLHDDAR